MIDLSPEYLGIIKQLIRQYVPDVEVWAFGSRVNWTANDYSDLDLVLKGQSKVPQKKYFQLQDALEESDLPIKVDVLDWHRITPEFRENIKKNYESIFTPADTDTLESMCELIVDCPHSTPKWADKGIVVLRNKNIKNGVLNLSSPSYTNEEDYKKRVKRAAPRVGDIVFTREAPMGDVCLIPEGLKCCLGQRQVLLRPNESVNGKYLFWALQSPFVQHQISWNEGTDSTVSNVRIPVLKALNIPRHPNKEDEIAKVLSKLTDKIELNRQTNQTLEQIAQALFKFWFVDFEPVKAKAQVRANVAQGKLPGSDQNTPLPKNFDVEAAVERAAMCAISGKSLEELEQLSLETQQQLKTTATLFPDALVESELGEIPEGWSVQRIEDVLDLAYGKALKKTERIDGKYPVYGSGGLTGMHNKYLVEGPGIIIGRKGSVGKLYWEDKSFYPIDTVFYVKCKNSMTLPFSYYMLQILGLEDMNTDAAVPGLNRNNAYRLEIPEYPNNLVEEFTNITSKIRKKINLVREEIKTLEAIRDSLLPKLLSSDLNLNNAA